MPNARVFGVEESRKALLVARVKFDHESQMALGDAISLIQALPEGWVQSFGTMAAPHRDRASFIGCDFVDLPNVVQQVDLVVGYQTLHWLDTNEQGMPKKEILRAIAASLAKDGVFLAGTSTAFVNLDPNELVEGKTLYQYSIDHHPFVRMVYDKIESEMFARTGTRPVPVSPTPSIRELASLLTDSGFSSVRVDGFLVTPGREQVISNVVRLRPEHQGRLGSSIDQESKTAIIEGAIAEANNRSDEIVRSGGTDPRLVETNIWDIVPFVLARK